MTDYSALHDATLQMVQLRWAEGTIRVEVIHVGGGVRRGGAIVGVGVTGISCGRAFPWGESQSINDVSLGERAGTLVLRIEMQSGDEISVQAKRFSFEEGDPIP
ncbi:MAG: hypothetical protein JKY37_22250 [Nannocystaceae bacterium]|nr:hypothetical protein [Nannocystaceae bacterium]